MTQLSKNEFADIPQDDPWKHDVLERKAVADYLTPVIASIRQPFVVSLHSSYGTGKTYFLKAWRQDLENAEYRTAYFNAWETDFSQDALSAFMVTIKRQLIDDAKSSLGKKFEGLLKGMSGFLRKEAAPMLAQAALRRIVGDEEAKALRENFGVTEENIANLAGVLASEALADQEGAERSMEDFRKVLGEVVDNLTIDEGDVDKKKIIIFVDELDRCRPTYAIEVLECVKHFFSIPGLVFVLAIDDGQLKNAIASVYGTALDGDGYLRRFIDWRFNIPDPAKYGFIRHLIHTTGIDELKLFELSRASESLLDLQISLDNFSRAFDLSLRDLERCITEINLILRNTGQGTEFDFEVLACVAVLRLKLRKELKEVFSGEADINSFTKMVQDRLKANLRENETILFQDVDRLISAFRAWFLDPQARRQLDQQIKEISNEMELLVPIAKNQSEKESLRQEQLELMGVVELHQSYRMGRRLTGSMASAAFERLETASRFSS